MGSLSRYNPSDFTYAKHPKELFYLYFNIYGFTITEKGLGTFPGLRTQVPFRLRGSEGGGFSCVSKCIERVPVSR